MRTKNVLFLLLLVASSIAVFGVQTVAGQETSQVSFAMPSIFNTTAGDTVSGSFFITCTVPATLTLTVTIQSRNNLAWQTVQWSATLNQTSVQVQANQWTAIAFNIIVPTTATAGDYRVEVEASTGTLVTSSSIPFKVSSRESPIVLPAVKVSEETNVSILVIILISTPFILLLSLVVIVLRAKRRRGSMTKCFSGSFTKDPEGPPDIFAKKKRD